MKPVVFTALVAVALVSIGLAVAKLKSACKEVTSTYLDGDWMDEITDAGGWESPIGSKVEANLEVGSDIPRSNKSLETKRCYYSYVKTKFTSIPVATECRYNDVNEQICIFKTKGTPAESVIKFYGDFFITMTDNSSYLVAYGCLLKSKHYWVGMVPKGQPLTSETRAEILQHVKDDLKLSIDPRHMKSEEDPVMLGKTLPRKCPKKQMKPKEHKDQTKQRKQYLPDADKTGDIVGRALAE